MRPRAHQVFVVPKVYHDLDRADKADKRKGWLKAFVRTLFFMALGGVGVMAAGWAPTLMGGQGVTW